MNTRTLSTARASRLRAQLVDFRAKHSLPALGAAIVSRDGHLELDVVGVRMRDGDDPAGREDRWHLGSCGKSITAALYARLVERGDAEWGARLPELFPDLADVIDPGWSAITIDDAFVSQAGLPANLGRAELRAALRDTTPIREQRTRVTAAALSRPPRRPGRFLYSNLGYILVGAAIERITGLSYEAALTTHVLEPLAITSGGFGPPPGAWGHGARTLRLGPLVLDLGRGAPADPARIESDNPPVMSPAGRLHLTLEDWAKFHRVFLTDGGDFLRPETVERLLTPAAGRGYRQALGWAPVHGVDAVSHGQQGSNTVWNAAALLEESRERTAMVVCNDGRAKLVRQLPTLALSVLANVP